MNALEERELRAKIKKLEERVAKLERLLQAGARIGELVNGDEVYVVRPMALRGAEDGRNAMAAALLGPSKT